MEWKKKNLSIWYTLIIYCELFIFDFRHFSHLLALTSKIKTTHTESKCAVRHSPKCKPSERSLFGLCLFTQCLWLTQSKQQVFSLSLQIAYTMLAMLCFPLPPRFVVVLPDWIKAWLASCYPTRFINWNEGRFHSSSLRTRREGCMQALDNGWSLPAAPLKHWFQPNIAYVQNTPFTSQLWLFCHLPCSSYSASIQWCAHRSHITWGRHQSWWEGFLALCLRRKNTHKLARGFIVTSSSLQSFLPLHLHLSHWRN